MPSLCLFLFGTFYTPGEHSLDSDEGSGLTTFRMSLVEVASYAECSFPFAADFRSSVVFSISRRREGLPRS